jgi:hypothetical protein
MRSTYNRLTRMYWGSNRAKRRTVQGAAKYRALKKAARRLDAKIATA